MTIDLNDVQVSDEVQISYLGLTSDEWFTVVSYDKRIILKNQTIWLSHPHLVIKAHRKNLQALKDALDMAADEYASATAKYFEAQSVLGDARKALEEAQKTSESNSLVGRRVEYIGSGDLRGRQGTIFRENKTPVANYLVYDVQWDNPKNMMVFGWTIGQGGSLRLI